MPDFDMQEGLYTLRLDQFRFAYELTDRSIIISAIIRPSMLQQQSNMLELASLMNYTFPDLIEALFKIKPTRSIKTFSKDKTESFITINIPTNNSSGSNRLDIKTVHERLLNAFDKRFDHFEIRWLGVLQPPTEPTARPSM